MDIIVLFVITLIGFIISRHVGNVMFTVLVKKLVTVKMAQDGSLAIIDGCVHDVIIFNLLRTVQFKAELVASFVLAVVFSTSSLRGPFTLLLLPACAVIITVIVLIVSASMSRSIFARLINYKLVN